MIKSLYLKNWKSHKETQVDFSNGANILVGDIGAGKTSLVEAIAFALFGTTQSVVSKGISVKDLIMQKPNKETSAEVILELEVDNHIYKIERQIFETKSSQARIYSDDLLIAGPKPQDVNKKIEDLFFVNFDLYMRANYSEQNQLDFFVKIQPRDRKIIFDNIFGIDFFESIEKNSKLLVSRIKDKVSLESSNLELNETTFKSQDYETLKTSLKELEQKISTKEKELKATLVLAETKKKILSEMKKNKEKFEALTKNLATLEGQILNLSNFLKESTVSKEPKEKLLHNLEKLSVELDALQSKKQKRDSLTLELSLIESQEKELKLKLAGKKQVNLETVQSDFKKLELEKTELDGQLLKQTMDYEYKKEKHNSDKKEYGKMKPILEKLQSVFGIEQEHQALQKEIDETKEKLSMCAQKLESLGAEFALLKKSDHTCPLCKSHLTPESQKQILNEKEFLHKETTNNQQALLAKHKELESKNKTLEKEYLFFIENKKELNKDYSHIEKEEKELSLLLKKMSEIQKEHNTILSSYDEKKKELEFATALQAQKEQLQELVVKKEIKNKALQEIKFDDLELKQKEKDKVTLEKQIELKKFEDDFKALILQKEKQEESLKNIKYSNNEMENTEKEYYEILTGISALSGSLDYDRKTQQELKTQEEKINAFKEKMDKSKSRIKKYSTYLEDLSLFNTVAKKTQEDLRKKIVDKINIIFSELWSQVYPYEDFKKVEILVKDGDYKIELQFNNHKRDLDSFISGGERSIVALCLRIAISLAMQNKLNLIILDEPTHNLDKKSITSLASLINEILPKYINQIFVITHDELLSSYSDNIIQVKRNKELDSASSV